MKDFKNSFIFIISFILFYFFIYQYNIKKYYFKKINYKETIKKHNELITINLYKKFNEPYLTSLKGSYRINYYKLFLLEYNSNKNIKNSINPLISVIVPNYNGEKFLMRSLLSIQSQTIQNFEIIYVDDCSTDNSIKLINELSLIDNRIKLYKNKYNRGTLYTKSFGVTQAKGKYILIIDQDDIYINKNLFKILYDIIKHKDLDIVQFRYNNYFLENDFFSYGENSEDETFNTIITQPELGNIQFFLNESLYKTFFLWDKLIKRETYINALKYLGEEIWGKKMIHREDHLVTFAIYKIAKNFMKIDLFGYSHLIYEGQESTDFYNIVSGKTISQEKYDKMLYYQFEFINFINNRTKENEEEKNIANRELLKIIENKNFANKIKNIKIKNFVISICNDYLKSIFISKKTKKILLYFLKLFYIENFKILFKFKIINIFDKNFKI